MLKLEAFIDDKKAAAVLHALDGLVLQLTILPVRNATIKGKKVVEAGHPTSGPEVTTEFISNAIKAKRDTFLVKEVVALGKTYGVKDTTIWSALNKLKYDKKIKLKSRGVYYVPKQQGV